jgi:hypothetical protein
MIPFLRKLSEVKDVRQFISKVIDYTAGSRTPVFNKRKAGQLIKLMGSDQTEAVRGQSHTGFSQVDLRSEIMRAQEIAAK